MGDDKIVPLNVVGQASEGAVEALEFRRIEAPDPWGAAAPISLAAERNKREQPDPEFVRKDDFGRPLYAFALEYQMDGGTWSTQVWAYSHEDAEARVAAMRESLAVRGQLFGMTPA
jgi:hypothetical protein